MSGLASQLERFGSDRRRRAVEDGLIVAGLLFAGYLLVVVAPTSGTFGFDAYAYWRVGSGDPYGQTAGALGAFTYTPVMAQLFSVFQLLPWPVFLLLWEAALVGTLIWLSGPRLRTFLALLAFPPVALELYHGNVHLLIAAAIVLGFRHPAAWTFPALTKVTPAVGVLWFPFRRSWRPLAIGCLTTGILVAVSFVADPALWADWLASVGATAQGSPLNQVSIGIPLWLRLPLAIGVLWWGARSDRAWTVPVAATLALPVLWVSGLSVLAAVPATLRLLGQGTGPGTGTPPRSSVAGS